MSLQDKLQKIASSNKSNWVEETGKQLSKGGVRQKARKIALRVLHVLKEKGMTQSELAERMGVSRQHVTKIVKGQENITLETIDKLEQALNVPLIIIDSPKEYVKENQISLVGSISLPHHRKTIKVTRYLKAFKSSKSSKVKQTPAPYISKATENIILTKLNLQMITQKLWTKKISVEPIVNDSNYVELIMTSENLDYSKS